MIEALDGLIAGRLQGFFQGLRPWGFSVGYLGFRLRGKRKKGLKNFKL